MVLAFGIVVIIYLITSAGKTPYDYFVRLADAFIHGRYYLTENPSWLSELIPSSSHKFYVPYPPGPSLLLTPLVFVFGNEFPQQVLAHILGAGIVVLTMLISLKIKKDKNLTVWSGALIGLGSIVWFLSSVGSAWYLGQITSCFFLTLALYEVLTKKRFWIIGVSLGFCYVSRPHVILSLPFFIYVLRNDFKKITNFIELFLPLSILAGFDCFYNFIRYGVPFNKAYFLLPKILKETNMPWFSKGVMNISYIPNGLDVAFLSLPKFLNHPPYVQPSWSGLSILITTPAFVFSLGAKLKEGIVKFSWLTIFFIFLVVLMHGGAGFAQFGYRFAVDFYPFLMLLTIKGVSRSGLKWYHWVLLFMGVIVNLWGVLWINKFGWVGY